MTKFVKLCSADQRRRVNLANRVEFRHIQRLLCQTKHLDLFVLASCSCLLALLHQPFVESLSPTQALTPSTGSATSLVSPSSVLEAHWVASQKRREPTEDSEAS